VPTSFLLVRPSNLLEISTMEKKHPKLIKIFNTNYLRTSYDVNGITEQKFQEAELVYNEKGLLVKETHFNNQNAIESIAVHEYNDDNLVILSSQFDENNELCQKNTFQYNENKKIVKKSCFYGLESPEYATIYVYENEQLIREDSYDEDEFAFTEKRYAYNESNLISRQLEYDEDGNVLYDTCFDYNDKRLICKQIRNEVLQKDRRTYIFEYDEANHKIKDLIYNFKDTLIAKTYYLYDDNGNVAETEEENLDTYRKTRYTYENNNCVKAEQLDKNEELMIWSEYEYNDQNDVTAIKNYITDEVDPTLFRIASTIQYETEWYD
jgi:hypothetical protein